jgi:cytochrome c oxidase cbb3-type subunit 3
MRIFNQSKNIASKNMGLKMAALVTMVLTSFGAFANGADSGISDTNLTIILLGMMAVQIALLYVISGVFKSLTANVSIWRKYAKVPNASLVLTALFVLSSTGVFAQDGASLSFVLDSGLEVLLISINGFLLLVIIVLLINVKKITNALKASADEEIATADDDLFSSIGLTDAVAIEDEDSILLDHDYDGIHELDNNLPPWWLWGFYITIFFAFVYMWYYFKADTMHVGNNEYVAEMQVAAAEAEARGASVDESTVKLLTSEADLAAGAEIFKTNCVACHLADGGGSVGPNLTDEFWIHGGGIKDVFRTIKVGVPEKGMISWESQLSPTDIQKVASFVKSLKGTTPAISKAPEGDKWTGE